MAKYVYRSKDWGGKIVKGEMDSSNEKGVVESLRANGLVPLGVWLKSGDLASEFVRKIKGRVTSKQVAALTRQLATMMAAGLPLTDSLALLKNQQEESGGLYHILETTLDDVRGGMALGKSLLKSKNIFGEAYVASISAGEEAGVLEEIMGKLATNLENENEFKGKIKGAMIYPVIVIIGMIIVVFIMMIFVIPKLTGLYADFGTAKMPVLTRGLMAVSGLMAKFWFLFPTVIGGGYLLFKFGAKNAGFRYNKDKYMLKFPIAGKLISVSVMANTCRTLSMLLTAGIPLVEALRIVATVAGNEIYKKAYLNIAERVQKGFNISASFENTAVFPVIVTQMIATGEATGKLDEVLLKVASYFSTEAEQAVASLTAAIEPLIMMVLGIGVGFLVVAVVMPIYNLTSSF
ncbi:MAG: type II secretion system F family protein [Patescibacteria group bacterium]